MKITFQKSAAAAGEDLLVRFFTKSERSQVARAVSPTEWSASANAVLHLHDANLLCVGLGETATAHAMRSAAGTAVSYAKKVGRTQLAFDLLERREFAEPAVEGAMLADYRFEKFKTEKTAEMQTLRLIVPDIAAAKRDGARGEAIADVTNFARDIGNQPGNVLFPESLAEEARKLAVREKLRVTIFDKKKLRARKFGGILAVGAGSEKPPCLIVLEHRVGPASQPPIALVGKAITFDTGGVSIKSAASMEEMIFDKCGGMAVLGAMAGIARLGIKRNVVGVIASAENMPGPGAYRPGDIVTTYDGKHVEIVNTDAEGRVVLADAIAYARKDLRAAAIIDLATLTGACGVALGDHAAGLWTSSDVMKNALLDAGEKTGERMWPMPLYDEFFDQIKSDVALVKNSAGRLGGACTAAAFLKTFAEETPWAHLDIAHVANITKDRADLARGATGFGVRTLIELVASWK
ncbi:MAG: leucyl aminopeptidase [Chthoniobacter sp.]|jgi:leucyl aminopeptidase|nr:leucyl aminopeptidase [Chthoniobacter sp.]